MVCLLSRPCSINNLNDADIDRIKEIAHVELEDAHAELECTSAAAHFIGDDMVEERGRLGLSGVHFARSCRRLAD